jgi:NADH dehydrogenase
MQHPMPHLLVVGGGFAGMWAALTGAREFALAGREARVTVIARDEYLTVRPRLYEVFTEAFRAPLAPVFAPLGISLAVGEVEDIDTQVHRVSFVDGDGTRHGAHYDRLVLAAGSQQRALPVPGAAEFAFDIDTFDGARRFDEQLRRCVEAVGAVGADTCVIVGAGFTGIELAAEMRNRLRAHGGAAAAEAARIVLVERAGELGPDLGPQPRPYIEEALRKARVELKLGTGVERIERDGVLLGNGERLAAATVVVAAGLVASPLAARLGVAADAQGRLPVDAALRVAGVSQVFAAGDIARARTDDTHFALMSCQHAVPMGKHAGYNAARELLQLPLADYRQPDYVTCLDLGDYGSLFTTGWDRQPVQWGAEVKNLKRKINTQWIYPPAGGREAILAAAAIDAPWPPQD